MLFFLVFITLFFVNTSTHAMSGLLTVDYTKQSEYDKKFIEFIRYGRDSVSQDILSGFQPSLFDALALSEINMTHDPSSTGNAIGSSEILSNAYSHHCEQENTSRILYFDEYLELSLRYARLALANAGGKAPKSWQKRNEYWEQTYAKIKEVNRQLSYGEGHRKLVELTWHDLENDDKQYFNVLNPALKKISVTETPLTALNMLEGKNGYKKRPLGAIALMAMLQHTHPECAEPYFMLGELAEGNNPIFARKTSVAYGYFQEALCRSPKDPRILNKLGTAYYHGWNGDADKDKAEQLWTLALQQADASNAIETLLEIKKNLKMLQTDKENEEDIQRVHDHRMRSAENIREINAEKKKKGCIIS